MTKNLYFTQGTKGEQNLIHDLIEEQIKMYGVECYYIPRKVYEDKLWNDIYHSQYRDSYLIEMYLENFENFGGKGDMLSKFGLRVTDEVTLTVSRRRWKDFVDLATNKIVAGRPNDGDLIFFPLNQTVFEIKYVENQKPFYQLNSLYVYTMTCEIFEYGDSIFDTGIEKIDNLEQESGVFPILMFPNGFGHYKPDETVIGTRFTATVSSAVLSGGTLGALTITNPGSGYITAPSVFFYDALGNYIATSTSTVSGGRVTNVNPPSVSYTYSGAPTVVVEDSPINYTARVGEWRPTERVLDVAYITGNFAPNELVKGQTSGAKWRVQSYDTLNMTDAYSENREIESKGDLIIDFTESNPFGEFGDIQGKLLMLGTYFYHKIIRKTVTTFGTLFNNIQLNTYDDQGNFVKQEKVPLAYGPAQKFLARLQQAPDLDRKFTITIPRMSFEMTGISYDGGRKVPPTQFNRALDTTGSKNKKQYMPVPYNIEFELAIIAKTQDDGLQIVEQILPFFQPQFTVTINLIPEMEETRDVPIILNSIDYNDDYEGDYTTRRYITWTLRFTAKTYLYGPVTAGNIIKKSVANINVGDKATNARVLKYEVQPKATSDQDGDGDVDAIDTSLLTAEDDFGFNEGITYYGP